MLETQIPEYFRNRRQSILSAHANVVFVLPSAPEMIRNNDVHHSYRQDSNLFYLTGFTEPESCLVLAQGKSILFVRKRDLDKEIWNGERYGVDRAKSVFGMDETYLIDELPARLPELLKGAKSLHTRLGLDAAFDRLVLKAMSDERQAQGRTGRAQMPVFDPMETLGEMRLIKSADEILLQRKACEISAAAHMEVIRKTRVGMLESEIEALIDFEFRKRGCSRVGFSSIVAGGKNATCLHYVQNNEPLREGELVLLDAGGEYQYYSGDITRTYPAGKKFSTVQVQVYDAVLMVQKECIARVKPGAKYADIHKHATERFTDILLTWGLLKGSREEILKNLAYKRFFPHGTGHYLGMDVHDVGRYVEGDHPRPLQPGMVLTVEPGLYFQMHDTDCPAEFKGIGVRIEDDVLVTDSGHEVLTKDALKERADLESLRS